MAFVRSFEEEHILVVANLSRFVQHVELDLSKYKGFSLVELFGRSAFPEVTDRPYSLSLGSHLFYWFALEKATGAQLSGDLSEQNHLMINGDWASLVAGANRPALDEILPSYLLRCEWLAAQGRVPKLARIVETIPLTEDLNPCIAIVYVEYADGEPERYVLPLAFLRDDAAEELHSRAPRRVLAELTLRKKTGDERGLVRDGLADVGFGRLYST